MKVFNFVGVTQKRLITLAALVTLTCVETLLMSTFARAWERSSNNVLTDSRQNLQAAGSYRCADSNGQNVTRVRVTEKNGVPSNLFLDLGNTNTLNLEISDDSKEGNGRSYTAYSPNSNATYKFIEYPKGKGKLLFTLEKPNGEQQSFGGDQRCVKIG